MKHSILIFISFLFLTSVFAQSVEGTSNKIQSPPTAPLPIAPLPPPPGKPRIVHEKNASSNQLPPAQNISVSYSNDKKDMIIVARPNTDTLYITQTEWNKNINGYETKYGKLPPLLPVEQPIRDFKATSDNFPVNKAKETTPPVQKVKN